MRVNIIMPKMGESINEGTIIKWYKKVGDNVKKDEIIYEIATDKVDTEIPSPEDGILVAIKAFEQETVPIDTVVGIIETDPDAASLEPAEPNEEKIISTTQVGGELIDIPMPKMGESVMEGTIIKWHKKVGQDVKRDEIIYEISTDKVDTEVPSPIDGVLEEILFNENETVDVGVAVARIRSKGGIVKSEQKVKDDLKIDEVPVKQEAKTAVTTAKVKSANRFYSPVVLNIANKEGLTQNDLERIEGTGISGRVTKKDVLTYLKNGGAKKATIAKSGEDSFKISRKTTDPTEIIPMDNTRQRIMDHMIHSKNTSVHVTAMIEVDMSKIHNYIQKNREKYLQTENIKLTYMPFIASTAIRGLKEYPLMNASIDGKNIVLKNYINLGIAVAVEPNGLIVPNIKNADEKSIRGLAKSINELGMKSRNKGLLPDDVVDGTFTITNYGVFGSLFGTPIINQPEVAILGVGAVTKKLVVVEVEGMDSIVIKPMMYLSLSHDHRLVDGMLGGKYLKYVKDSLENFDVSVV